jgi:hypothetical protein
MVSLGEMLKHASSLCWAHSSSKGLHRKILQNKPFKKPPNMELKCETGN